MSPRRNKVKRKKRSSNLTESSTVGRCHEGQFILDRTQLTHDQHMEMLATPRGYQWAGLRNLDGRRKVKIPKRRKIKEKLEDEEIGDEFTQDIWGIVSPLMIERLKNFLIYEFDMPEREASEFINSRYHEVEQPRSPKFEQTHITDSDTKLKWIKEFSDAFSKRIEQYIVGLLMQRRSPEVTRVAERILEQLCHLTGKKTTLHNPKTKNQKTMVLIADRLALWVVDLMKDIYIPQKNVPEEEEQEDNGGEEDEYKEKDDQSKEDVEDKQEKDKDDDMEKTEQEDKEEDKEIERSESIKDEEREDEPQPETDDGQIKKEPPEEEEIERKETEKEEASKLPDPEAKVTQPDEKTAKNEENPSELKESEKPKEIDNPKEPKENPIVEPEQPPQSKKSENEQKESPVTVEKSKENDSPTNVTEEEKKVTETEIKPEDSNEPVVASEEPNKQDETTKEDTEAAGKSEETLNPDEPPEEPNTFAAESEEPTETVETPSEPPKSDEEPTNPIDKPDELTVPDQKSEETLKPDESFEEPRTSIKEPEESKETSGKPRESSESVKQPTIIEKPTEDAEVLRKLEKSRFSVILNLIKEDIADNKTNVRTPRQKEVKEAVDKRIDKIIGEDIEVIQPEDIDDAASRVAHWVERILGEIERPTKIYRSPGPAFGINMNTGSTLKVQKLSSGTVVKTTAQIRGLELPHREKNIPASESVMNMKSAAEWDDRVLNVAEEWGRWIDSTLTGAEKQVTDKVEGNLEEGSDWKQWRNQVKFDALKWRTEQGKIKKQGMIWNKPLEENPDNEESELRSTDFS